MNIHETMHYLAQGAINITEGSERAEFRGGHAILEPANPKFREAYEKEGVGAVAAGTFIQQGSHIHEALESICRLFPPGEAFFDIKGARIKEILTRVPTPRAQHWIMHPSNDAILATCKSRKDAEVVITCLNTLADYFGVR